MEVMPFFTPISITYDFTPTAYDLSTLEEFAELIGHDIKSLQFWAYNAKPRFMYRPFTIKKRSGDPRLLHAPHFGLKEVQKKIYKWLDGIYNPPSSAHGYIRDKSIVTNARAHIGKSVILKLDIANFYPSITTARIKGLLLALRPTIEPRLVDIIVRLCTLPDVLGGGLPQGAPTSPILSNMICLRMDKALTQLARKHYCFYSRYSDDITLSIKSGRIPPTIASSNPNNLREIVIGEDLRNLLAGEGFDIKVEKSRLLAKKQCRQQVTGIVVNKKCNVDRRYIRKIRTLIHNIKQQGLLAATALHNSTHKKIPDNHPYKTNNTSLDLILKGMISHVRSVRGCHDPLHLKLVDSYNSIPNVKKIRLPIAKHCVWEVSSGASVGTAVSVKGIGIVTCDHVVSTGPIYIQNAALGERHLVSIRNRLISLDLAELELITPKQIPFLESDTLRVEMVENLEIYGFQQGGPRMQLSSVNSRIRATGTMLPPDALHQTVTLNGETADVEHIEVWHTQADIYEGGSGGPLIDAKTQKVIGIVQKGRTENLLVSPTIALPIKWAFALKEFQLPFANPNSLNQ